MALNDNNFLRFEGGQTPKPWINNSAGYTTTLFSNQDYIDIVDPFTLCLCTATLGIDPYSFLIVDIVDYSSGSPGATISMSEMSSWDASTLTLRIFRPIDLSLTAFSVEFTFQDYLGNKSEIVYIVVNVDSIVIEWSEYIPSDYCTLDNFGNNTGYRACSQLVMRNALTHTNIIPLTLKDNESSSADYISPTFDLITCPSPSTTGLTSLMISNFSQNNADPNPNDTITITNIYLQSTILGSPPPISLNIPCNIPPGSTQRFNIPSGNWDGGLTISYSVKVGGDMVAALGAGFGRFWIRNNNGVITGFPSGSITTNPVDNSGIYGPNAITLPVSPSVTTILVQ